MAVAVRVRGDFKKWRRDMKRIRKSIVPKAQQRAMTAAVRRFNTETVRSVAASTGVPQKVLRPRKRVGSKGKAGGRIQPLFPTRADPFRGGLRGIWYPVDAAQLGKLRQTRTGVSVKGHAFPGAFTATMPSNNRFGAFKRKGQARLPIKKQTIPLNPMGDRIAGVKLVRVGRRVAIKEFERQTALALRRR